MTARQYKRLRKWEKRVEPAYSAGFMDGQDMAYTGEPRPNELVSELDITVYFRRYMRHAQGVSNAAIARSRGRVDGFDMAMHQIKQAEDEDFIEAQVERGMEQIESYLRERAA